MNKNYFAVRTITLDSATTATASIAEVIETFFGVVSKS